MTSVESHQDEQPLEYVARYGDREFRYHLCYVPEHKKATIRVHVHPNGMVQVDAPESAQLPAIKSAVQRRARWILKNLDDIAERHRDVRPRQWVSGESMLYLGRRYTLKIIQDPEQQDITCKMTSGQIRVQGNHLNAERVRKNVLGWYRNKAYEVFARRFSVICKKLPWIENVPPWRVREMQTQWGSCSPQGTILLNPHLVKAPTQAIDYVLLHELCHLEEHNHSARFYELLGWYMPNWRSVKKKLDSASELLLNSPTDNQKP